MNKSRRARIELKRAKDFQFFYFAVAAARHGTPGLFLEKEIWERDASEGDDDKDACDK